jgi:Bax protein
MRLSVRSVLEGGRLYAFPMAWATVLAGGVGLYQPLPQIDASQLLAFNVIPPAAAEPRLAFAAPKPDPVMSFVHFDIEPEDTLPSNAVAGGHGRFAAPGNAVRRQIQV